MSYGLIEVKDSLHWIIIIIRLRTQETARLLVVEPTAGLVLEVHSATEVVPVADALLCCVDEAVTGLATPCLEL